MVATISVDALLEHGHGRAGLPVSIDEGTVADIRVSKQTCLVCVYVCVCVCVWGGG